MELGPRLGRGLSSQAKPTPNQAKPTPYPAKPTPNQAKPVEARGARRGRRRRGSAADARVAAESAAEPADLRLMYSVLARAVRAHAERGDTGAPLQPNPQAQA